MTPEPQVVTMGRSRSTPACSKAANLSLETFDDATHAAFQIVDIEFFGCHGFSLQEGLARGAMPAGLTI